jgi:hypothetical protein
MDNVVGVRARDKAGRPVAFMMWGRLFDSIEPSELIQAVSDHSIKFAGAPFIDIRICDSLSEISDYQYFYEALLHFAWQPVPTGNSFKAWRLKKRRGLVQSAVDLYFLGPSVQRSD